MPTAAFTGPEEGGQPALTLTGNRNVVTRMIGKCQAGAYVPRMSDPDFG